MGLVSFAPTMACSVAMAYLTMAEWWFLRCRELPFGADLGIYLSIRRVSRSDGGCCTVSLSCSWRPAACSDDIGHIQCHLSCAPSLSWYLRFGDIRWQYQAYPVSLVIFVIAFLLSGGRRCAWTIAGVACVICRVRRLLQTILRFSRVGSKINNYW